ncbi:hypothetical protein BU14_0465s0013 [Porphyra umbilicalis]|uniref:Peptidase M13 C-terminal domain-containing protein n=1 Tax=Porphyra umbilicalis TaxID=2786 RepID=A0A1X6NU47_PORUM|nr:hypothetical protein BU14_0465s0013 [Porphyra umbilicalis]|eukprot:OSX72122.1 hypothetical protein BU14_0465s0013 [Porphyra umbilicalis]
MARTPRHVAAAVAAAALTVTAAAVAARGAAAARQAPPEPADAAQVAAGVLALLDRTTDPCVDFYRFACGGFDDAAALPAGVGVVGRSKEAVKAGTAGWMAAALGRGAAAVLAAGGAAVEEAQSALATDVIAAACAAGWLRSTNCRSSKRQRRAVETAMEVERRLATTAHRALFFNESRAGDEQPLLHDYAKGLGVATTGNGFALAGKRYFVDLMKAVEERGFRADLPIYFAYAVTVDLARRQLLGPELYAAFVRHIQGTSPAAYAERPTTERECVVRTIEALPDDLSTAIVQETTWLDATSKAAALDKIKQMQLLAGVDEKTPAVTAGVVVAPGAGAHVANTISGGAARVRRQLDRLTSAAAAARWENPAFTFQASYSPRVNRITFYSATLRWPLLPTPRELIVPTAILLGSASMVAGHELGHLLDTTGVFYDGKGERRLWLSRASRTVFEERTTCIAEQYSNYTVGGSGGDPPLTLNGKDKVNEALADSFGIQVAVAQLARMLSGPNPAHPLAETNPALYEIFTDEQLFWTAAAQMHCAKRSRLNLERYAKRNPHAPETARVRGMVTHHPGFAKAFRCPADSPYLPTKRCTVYGE